MDPNTNKFPVVYKPDLGDFKRRLLGFGILMLLFFGLLYFLTFIEKAKIGIYMAQVVFGLIFLFEAWAAIRSSCKEIRLEKDRIIVIRLQKTEELPWDELKRIWLDSTYWLYKGNITLLHGKSELIRGKIRIPREYKVTDEILDVARQRGIPITKKPMSTIGG